MENGEGTGDGMGRERERRKYCIDFGSETPCTSARQWRRQDFVSGGGGHRFGVVKRPKIINVCHTTPGVPPITHTPQYALLH